MNMQNQWESGEEDFAGKVIDKGRTGPTDEIIEKVSTEVQNRVDFQFINLSHPLQAADPMTKKFVRQQVQRKNKKALPYFEGSENYSEPEASELPFLNFSNPSQASTAGAKRFVRQQVQLRHQRKLAEADNSKALVDSQALSEIICDDARRTKHGSISSSTGGIDDFRSQFWLSDIAEETSRRTSRRVTSPLNAKIRIRSFIYPVQMNEDMYRLVEYLHADYESTNIIPAFRTIWFGMILRDPASFLQQLSTTVMHQMFVHGTNDEKKALMYQQRALQSVNKRLSDPVLGLSDGVVGTVVSFLTSDHIVKDIQRYKIHKVGLARIIALRGGIETLEDNEVVRLMILWEEVCGACAFNVPPNYPLPTRHIPALPTKPPIAASKTFVNTIYSWRRLYPHREDFVKIFLDFHILNCMIQVGLPKIWEDPWFLGLRINPIVLRLLPSETVFDGKGPGELIETACRLAALIYLGDIRVAFMEYHVMGCHFVEKLSDIMAYESEEWEEFQELKLWVLTVGAIKASAAGREIFVEGIQKMVEVMDIETWDEVVQIVSDIIWLDEVYGQRFADLGKEIIAT